MSGDGPSRILLVDDHDVVRHGMRALLESHPGWVICAEAADGRTAVRLAKELAPHLVVMDVTVPELNGLDAARQITTHSKSTPVLMVSMHENEEHIRQALAAGVRGYVLKTSAGRHLIAAAEELMRDGVFFTSQSAANIYAAEFAGAASRRNARSRRRLTPREREILQLLAEGKKNKDVASALHISVKTAETHRARIMAKLEIGSVAELVRYAIRNGLIAP